MKLKDPTLVGRFPSGYAEFVTLFELKVKTAKNAKFDEIRIYQRSDRFIQRLKLTWIISRADIESLMEESLTEVC